VIGLPVLVDHGTLVLHPDLAWPDLRLVIEYEGDEHRESKRRFRADIRRREKFEAAGWRVIRVTADDLGEELDAFIERVRTIVSRRRVELPR
jgi:very-short-patch-repair endonuclease